MNNNNQSCLKKEKLTVANIMDVLRDLSPGFPTSDEREGLIYGQLESKATRIGVVWDLSTETLKLMIQDGIDVVITHTYPFIQSSNGIKGYEKTSTTDKACNQVKKNELEKHDITVIRVHTSWDNAPDGNNDTLAKLIGLRKITRLPLARAGMIEPVSLKDFAMNLKGILNTNTLKITGDLKKTIHSLLVIAGTGFDFQEFIDYAITEGIDVIISSDLNKKTAKYASESGIILIDVNARETEAPGLKELTRKLNDKGLNAKYYESEETYTYL